MFLFLFKFPLALGAKQVLLLFPMSRVHEIGRGGVGASEVSANCQSVFSEGPTRKAEDLQCEYAARCLLLRAE